MFITEEGLRKTERFFLRYGPTIVLVARFLDVFRQLNGIVAGITRMPFMRFQFYSALGAGVWVGCWGALAYGLGHGVKDLHETFTRIKYGLLAALFIAAIVMITGRLRERSGRKKDGRL